jgi:hypothetical protein
LVKRQDREAGWLGRAIASTTSTPATMRNTTFIAMAALNEVVWRTQSTDVWVTFKLFGLAGLTILFILSQIPFVTRQTRLAEASSQRSASSDY